MCPSAPDPYPSTRDVVRAGMNPAIAAAALAVVLTGCGDTGTITAGSPPSQTPSTSAATTTTPDPYDYEAETTEPVPAVVKAGFGDDLSSGDAAASGTISVSEPKEYRREPGEFGDTAKNGRFLVYKVTLVADRTAAEPWSVNPYDFAARDENGTRFDPNASAMFGSTLHSAELNPGEKLTGLIDFDVPRDEKITLLYVPQDRTLAEWPAQ